MNDPQIWTLIGVFAAIMLGGMTAMTTLILRATSSAIGGLRAEMNARFDTVEARFEAVDARFEAVDARFEAVNVRFDALEKQVAHLDRDVAAVTRRMWGEKPEA